jgi:hypothetical protein
MMVEIVVFGLAGLWVSVRVLAFLHTARTGQFDDPVGAIFKTWLAPARSGEGRAAGKRSEAVSAGSVPARTDRQRRFIRTASPPARRSPLRPRA